MKEVNLNYNEFENLIYNKSPNKIKSCLIELTNCCNFRCEHCYVDKQKHLFLDVNLLRTFLIELHSIGCMEVTFTGGETLLYPYFKEIYLFAKNLGFFVNINTNASLLNESIIEFFIQFKPKLIEISLYGYNNKTYDDFTKTVNMFEKVKNAINLLKKANLSFALKTPISKKNYKHLNELKDFAKQNNCEFRWDYYIFPSIGKEIGLNSEQVPEEELIEIFKQDDEIVEYFKNKIKNLKLEESNKIFQCTGGEENLFLDCEGVIHMCISMRNSVCKYPNYSIKDAINYFKEFKEQEFSENNVCKNCNKKSICKYCPARFQGETGDFCKPHSWHCNLANLIIKNFK